MDILVDSFGGYEQQPKKCVCVWGGGGDSRGGNMIIHFTISSHYIESHVYARKE